MANSSDAIDRLWRMSSEEIEKRGWESEWDWGNEEKRLTGWRNFSVEERIILKLELSLARHPIKFNCSHLDPIPWWNFHLIKFTFITLWTVNRKSINGRVKFSLVSAIKRYNVSPSNRATASVTWFETHTNGTDCIVEKKTLSDRESFPPVISCFV